MKTNTVEKSKFKRLANSLKVDTSYDGNDFAFMLIISDKKYHNLFKSYEPEIYKHLMQSIKSPQWKFTTGTILNEAQIHNLKDFFVDIDSSAFLIKYLRSIWKHPDADKKYMVDLVENFYTYSDKYNLIYEIYERKHEDREASTVNFILNHFKEMDEQKSM